MRDEGLRVAGDVQTIQLTELLLHLFFVLVEVHRYDPCAGTFQKLHMRSLDELLGREGINDIVWMQCLLLPLREYLVLDSTEFFIPFATALNWLSKNTNYWVLGLLSHVVASSDHW